MVRFVVDGAWKEKLWEGAAAWCGMGSLALQNVKGTCRFFASSVLMTEALAILKALECARSGGWRRVEIFTNCLLILKGLTDLSSVDIFVQSILADIMYLAKCFSFVCVCKVPRQVVKTAHALAKQCMA